jgi:hypothetical protein
MRYAAIIAVLAALAATIPVGPAAAATTWQAVVDGGVLTLVPSGPFEHARLEVEGPDGLRLRRQFPGHDVVQLPLLAPDGSALPDGVYRYEIRSGGASIWQGAFRVESAEARHVGDDDAHGSPIVRRPDEPAAVEHHFTDDLGTTEDICAGCSASFEPGESNFGSERLMILDQSPGIDFLTSESTDQLGNSWEVGSTSLGFYIKNPVDHPGGMQFTIEPGAPVSAFSIEDTGHIGIGTNLPDHSVHVRQVGAKVLVDDTNPTVGPRPMFELLNQAGNQTIFRLNDGAAGVWDFKVTLGGFIVNEVGDGNEMVVDKWGNVTATSFNPTSSRNEKTGFEQVDRQGALERLVALPISEWSFRDDRPGVRHVGPFAEDFHAAFGLNGDDPARLSLTDVQGVSIAAIQALAEKVESLESQVAELQAANEELRDRQRDLCAQ